jgi:hypothetical protein
MDNGMSDSTLNKRRGRQAQSVALEAMPDEDPFDLDYRQILADLKEQAKTDLGAKKLWIDIYQANQATKEMDFVLNITPYDIDDKKLSVIVQQADVPVVLEMLDGLAVRLEADEFNSDCKLTLRAFRRLFTDEADRLYAVELEKI